MIKELIKRIVLKVLAWVEKKPTPIVTEEIPFWYREVRLPLSFIIITTGVFILLVLAIEIGPSPEKILSIIILLILTTVLFITYMKRIDSELSKDNDAMMLLGLLLILTVLFIESVKSIPEASPYIVPIAGMAILASLLLSEQVSMIFIVVVSFASSILNGFRIEYLFFHFMSGIVAVALSRRIVHRQDVTYSCLKIILVNAMLILIMQFLMNSSNGHLRSDLLWVSLNGFISMICVFGLLSPLETFFSRITNIKLLELADFNQPLLKRLIVEAPGTYHHSLTVASIAEHSAESIGVNTLMVRVGAYYHDIGKLVKPEYFIENQRAMDNPHDSIPPSMSGLLIISHVKEGIKLARQKNLDKPIIEMIEQHHGTSVMHSIYRKALEKNGVIPEHDFRYPGPKPLTKESVVLMLADACEAASRLIEEPTNARLRDMVEKIINDKFTDGQFNNSPITLSDLNKIAESIVSTLTGIFHSRIEYEEKENNKPKDTGS